MHDFYCNFKYVRILIRIRHEFLVDRQCMGNLLADGIHHIPKCHIRFVAGDFNILLNEAVPYIYTADKK